MIHFCFGNGNSRKGIDIEKYKKYGTVVGCNAIYRDFTPDILVAEIRSAGDLNNPIIGVLTFTYNKEWKKGTLMMTLPSQFETCILGYGVNWEFFPPLKKILDEGNESK